MSREVSDEGYVESSIVADEEPAKPVKKTKARQEVVVVKYLEKRRVQKAEQRRSRRMAIIVLLLAVLWGSAARAEEDEKCAASPRWIAVTVVKAHVETPKQEMEIAAGVKLLDRCYGDQVEVGAIPATSRSPKDVAARSEGAKSFVWQASGTGDDIVMRTFFVKETVQQICAAMDDCRDATRPREERGHSEQ